MRLNPLVPLIAFAICGLSSAQETVVGLYYGTLVHRVETGDFLLDDAVVPRQLGFETLTLNASEVPGLGLIGFRGGLNLEAPTKAFELDRHLRRLDQAKWNFSAEIFGYLNSSQMVRPYYAAGGVLGVIPSLSPGVGLEEYSDILVDLGLRVAAGVEFGPEPAFGAFFELGYQHQVFVTREDAFGDRSYAFLGDEEGYGDSIGDWEQGLSARFGIRVRM